MLPLVYCVFLGKTQHVLGHLMNSKGPTGGRVWALWLPIIPFLATGGAGQPQLISRDWPGVPGQVDAAMAGRIYISGSAPSSSRAKNVKFMRRNRNRKRYRSRHSRQNSSRKSRSSWLSLFSSEETGLGAYNDDDYEMDWLVPATCEPIQSVYFFSGGGSPCHPCSWSSRGPPWCPWFP